MLLASLPPLTSLSLSLFLSSICIFLIQLIEIVRITSENLNFLCSYADLLVREVFMKLSFLFGSAGFCMHVAGNLRPILKASFGASVHFTTFLLVPLDLFELRGRIGGNHQ